MGWIGIAGGNAMGGGKKYTPAEYDAVLQFFINNTGDFFKIRKIAQLNSLPENTTQAIVDAQVADPSTGVIEDKGPTYGIPKKSKK